MNEEIKTFFNNVLEKLFPSNITCFLCNDEVGDSEFSLCEKCEKTLPWNKNFCLKCGTPVHSLANYCLSCKNYKRYFKYAKSPLIYKDKIAFAIKQFKYDNKKYLAKYFAKFLELEYRNIKMQDKDIDYIIPVPIHENKIKSRGYNQSNLLAEQLSKMINIPVLDNVLLRIKETKSQTKLSFAERQENLESAFKVLNKSKIKGKSILLIDDVLTTGSTASHCSKCLLEAKAKEVVVLTIATTDSDKT